MLNIIAPDEGVIILTDEENEKKYVAYKNAMVLTTTYQNVNN
jgi:hypothetical protein